MSVANYRDMLKCSFGDEVDKELFVQNLIDILCSITNKTENYVEQLNLLDVLYLILDIYSNSLGSCKLVATYDKKTFNIELDLQSVKETILAKNNVFFKTVDLGSFEILLSPPSLKRTTNTIECSYLEYIKGIQANGNVITTFESDKQVMEFLENLPVKVVNEIIDAHEDIMDACSRINFLSTCNLDNVRLIFYPTIESTLHLIQLFFGENLQQFYENFFHLSYTGNMNSAFLETIAVGEFNYFIGLLRHALNPPTENNSSNSDVGTQEDPFN